MSRVTVPLVRCVPSCVWKTCGRLPLNREVVAGVAGVGLRSLNWLIKVLTGMVEIKEALSKCNRQIEYSSEWWRKWCKEEHARHFNACKHHRLQWNCSKVGWLTSKDCPLFPKLSTCDRRSFSNTFEISTLWFVMAIYGQPMPKLGWRIWEDGWDKTCWIDCSATCQTGTTVVNMADNLHLTEYIFVPLLQFCLWLIFW